MSLYSTQWCSGVTATASLCSQNLKKVPSCTRSNPEFSGEEAQVLGLGQVDTCHPAQQRLVLSGVLHQCHCGSQGPNLTSHSYVQWENHKISLPGACEDVWKWQDHTEKNSHSCLK
jgi:hypothetical protein